MSYRFQINGMLNAFAVGVWVAYVLLASASSWWLVMAVPSAIGAGVYKER